MANVPLGIRTRSAPLSAPRDMYIVLTSRCNLLCRHCYGHFGEPHLVRGELSGDEWLSVFQQAAKLGVFFVNIAGGEPTLHPQFPRIIDGLVDLGLHFILTTNGLSTPTCLDAIVRAKDHLLGLKVSIDGPTSGSHGWLRVGLNGLPSANAFDQTIRTARHLRDNGIPYTIASCLHKGNIDLMEEFEALIGELRPTSWFLATISPTGRAKVGYRDMYVSDERWSYEYWQQLRGRLTSNGVYVRYIDMSVALGAHDRPSPFSCPAATEFCEINSDGTVSPCPLSRTEIPTKIMSFENIRDKSLQDIWNGEVFGRFRSYRSSGCDGCALLEGCGRCVAQSIQWWEDPAKPPPYCIGKGDVLGLTNLPALREELSSKMNSALGVR